MTHVKFALLKGHHISDPKLIAEWKKILAAKGFNMEFAMWCSQQKLVMNPTVEA